MTTITITGNLTRDPELRFTPSGTAVCNLAIAVNHRKFDKQAGEWVDDGTDFYEVATFGKLAEKVPERLSKGRGVIVTGRLKSRSFEGRDGQKRTVWEIAADDIGPSLRMERDGASSGGSAPRPAQQQGDPWAGGGRQQPAGDPWAQQEAPF